MYEPGIIDEMANVELATCLRREVLNISAAYKGLAKAGTVAYVFGWMPTIARRNFT